MFDTNRVANNIKEARTKLNMTQMNLADEMGVSYQAVSNWERGNSMPDISKLPELCNILNISFEELVGERTSQTDIAEKMMQDEEVTLEEVAQVGQLVKPEKIEHKVKETIKKGDAIPFSVLVELAPFMDSDTLGKMAEEIAEVDFEKLDEIIPFIDRQTMDRIINRCIQQGNLDADKIILLAPFLPKASIKKLVQYLVQHNRTEELVELAPFMSKEMFASLRTGEWESSASRTLDENIEEDTLDDLDEDDLARHAFAAFEKGEDVTKYLPYMDDEDIAKLAIRTLEKDGKTEVFLGYMDEDDVEQLAMKALEAGKPIECYLAYLDEDAIKRLLLKSIKSK